MTGGAPPRARRAALVAAAALVLTAVAGATAAWAAYTGSTAPTESISPHQLVTPGTLTCSGLGIASAHFSWTATSDASVADVYGSGNQVASYEVGKSTTSSSGPFTFVNNGTSTSYDASALLVTGEMYFVVRTVKSLWRSANSPVLHVHVTALLLASCP